MCKLSWPSEHFWSLHIIFYHIWIYYKCRISGGGGGAGWIFCFSVSTWLSRAKNPMVWRPCSSKNSRLDDLYFSSIINVYFKIKKCFIVSVDFLSSTWVYSLWPCDVIWCHGAWSSLAEVMAWRLFGAKTLPQSMMTFYQLNHQEQLQWNLNQTVFVQENAFGNAL